MIIYCIHENKPKLGDLNCARSSTTDPKHHTPGTSSTRSAVCRDETIFPSNLCEARSAREGGKGAGLCMNSFPNGAQSRGCVSQWAIGRAPARRAAPRFECFSVGLLASAAPDRVSRVPGSRSRRSEKGSGEEKRDCARGGGTNCVSSAEGRGGSLRGLVGRPGP